MLLWDPREMEEDPERYYGLDFAEWLSTNPGGTFEEFHAYNARMQERICSKRPEVVEQESGLMDLAADLARTLAKGLRRAA